MGEIRLILCEREKTKSGLFPSVGISSVLWATSKSYKPEEFWRYLTDINKTVISYFDKNLDEFPILEGYDDGLLVINWQYRCIESFQSYQPLKRCGKIFNDDMLCLEEKDDDLLAYCLPDEWNIVDHHFGEIGRVNND